MPSGVVGRYRRAGQDEATRPAAHIHRTTYMVPDRRHGLPFVDQARPRPFQHETRLELRRVPQSGVHVEKHLARRAVPAGGRLPAGAGAFDQHRSSHSEPGGELLVDDAWTVFLCQTIAPGSFGPIPIGTSSIEVSQSIESGFRNEFNRDFATNATEGSQHAQSPGGSASILGRDRDACFYRSECVSEAFPVSSAARRIAVHR